MSQVLCSFFLFSFSFFLLARHEANSVDNEHTNMLTSSSSPPPFLTRPPSNLSSPCACFASRKLAGKEGGVTRAVTYTWAQSGRSTWSDIKKKRNDIAGAFTISVCVSVSFNHRVGGQPAKNPPKKVVNNRKARPGHQDDLRFQAVKPDRKYLRWAE